jgi:hypothetical protein
LLVEKLKFEEDAIRIKSIRLDNGENLSRNERYVRMEYELQRFFENYLGENFGVEFVFRVINFLFYD